MWRFILGALAALAVIMPARAQIINVPTINGSVGITTGNTFQQVLAAAGPPGTVGSPRQSLTIQNNNTNGDNCWIYIGGSGAINKPRSILLGQGGSYQRYYPFVPSDAIQATCASNGDTLYIDIQ